MVGSTQGITLFSKKKDMTLITKIVSHVYNYQSVIIEEICSQSERSFKQWNCLFLWILVSENENDQCRFER